MNTKQLFILCLLLSLTASLSAQSLQGRVLDSQGNALEWATVSLLSTADSMLITGTITDEQGAFHFQTLTETEVILRIDFVGFTAQEQTVATTKDVDLGELVMRSDVTLTEIVVKGTKPKISYREGTLIYDVSEVENIGTSGMELLRTVPLLRIDKDDNLLVRGKATKVLINGQDLNLNGDELKAYLDALNTEDIAKVEVVSNPSSKYEAEGTGGIINIVLKERKPGYYASMYSKVGYGDYPKYKIGANVSYFVNKLGVSASVYPGYSKSNNLLTIDRTNNSEGNQTSFQQVNNWNTESKWITGNASLNYALTKRSSISTFFKGSFSGTDGNTTNESRMTGLDNDSLSLVQNGNNNWNTYTLGTNYQINLDSNGTNLSMEYLLIKAGNKENQEQTTQYFNGGMLTPNPFDLANRVDYNYTIHSGKIDYLQPFKQDYTLETGIKFSDISSLSKLDYITAPEDEEYLLIPLQSNDFQYNERNYAAFVSANKKLNKWNFRTGLRLEYTQLETLLESDQSLLQKDNYLEFFPSLGLSYQIKEGQTLSGSYSRRLTRPYYADMNPSISFIDQYSYRQGNPLLRPEFANLIEIGYQKGATVLTAYTTISQGTTGEVLLQDDESSVIITTKKNLNSSKSFGLNFNTSFRLFKLIDAAIHANGGYQETVFEEGDIIVNQHIIEGDAYLSLKYPFRKYFSVSASGNYNTPTQYGLYKVKQNYGINLGATFNKNNFTLSLRWNDIFRTGKWDSTVAYDNLDAHWLNRWETGIAYLSLRYKFGNNEAKRKGSYQKDTYTEEGGRIKN